jgi:hypothetical protein
MDGIDLKLDDKYTKEILIKRFKQFTPLKI